MLMSDNGASQEGGPFGVLHEMKYFNFLVETPDEAVDRLDDIGGPHSHTNYPWGWAQAGNTPFQLVQAEHPRGRRPRPAHRALAGPHRRRRRTARPQFHHVSDVAPTIYELAGITPPGVYRGREQMPITGTSMRLRLRRTGRADQRQAVQYFEMMGHRGDLRSMGGRR
ncbi:MAG: hypothetical protein V9E94_04875 [Microthrixaceae bacterium]